jgi:hypothetical protein
MPSRDGRQGGPASERNHYPFPPRPQSLPLEYLDLAPGAPRRAALLLANVQQMLRGVEARPFRWSHFPTEPSALADSRPPRPPCPRAGRSRRGAARGQTKASLKAELTPAALFRPAPRPARGALAPRAADAAARVAALEAAAAAAPDGLAPRAAAAEVEALAGALEADIAAALLHFDTYDRAALQASPRAAPAGGPPQVQPLEPSTIQRLPHGRLLSERVCLIPGGGGRWEQGVILVAYAGGGLLLLAHAHRAAGAAGASAHVSQRPSRAALVLFAAAAAALLLLLHSPPQVSPLRPPLSLCRSLARSTCCTSDTRSTSGTASPRTRRATSSPQPASSS